MPGTPYPAALSANTRTADWSVSGVESAVWLFSTQKTAGSRRAAQRLIASCHSPSDDPPSPMNETATRPDPSRQNAIAIPAMVNVAVVSGAAGGRMPLAKSPMCRSLPSSGAPTFPICALRTMRTVSGSGRMARVAPRSRITGPMTSPVHRPSGPRYAAPRRSRIAAA